MTSRRASSSSLGHVGWRDHVAWVPQPPSGIWVVHVDGCWQSAGVEDWNLVMSCSLSNCVPWGTHRRILVPSKRVWTWIGSHVSQLDTVLWAAAGLREAGSLPFSFHVDLPGLAGEATLSHPELLLVLAPYSEIFWLCCPTWLAVHSYYFCRLEAPPFPVFLITWFPTSSCERFNSVLWAFMGCLQVGSCFITNLPPCFPRCLKPLICMFCAPCQCSGLPRWVVETGSLVYERSAHGWLSPSLFSLPCGSAVFCCLVCTQNFAWQSVGSLSRVGSQGSGGRERILEEKMTLSIASTKAIEYTQLAVYRIVDKYG